MGTLHRQSKEDWYDQVLNEGNYLWDVPPAAGEVAVEQLAAHVHGVPESLHIFLIPRLCTNLWRKQLGKVCDLILTIKPMQEFWGCSMHEPLLICFYFPILPNEHRFRPWQLKGTRVVGNTERKVRGMQADNKPIDGLVLRELLLLTRRLPSMQPRLARKLLQTEDIGQVPNCRTQEER